MLEHWRHLEAIREPAEISREASKFPRLHLLRMLQWADPNGIWLDRLGEREGYEPLSKEAAVGAVIGMVLENRPVPPPAGWKLLGHTSMGIVAREGPYSVCKLVDADPRFKEYLSFTILIYNHRTMRLSIIDVKVRNIDDVQTGVTFCGRGPDNFDGILEFSNEEMERSQTQRRLICREGLKDLSDVAHFATSHFWGEEKVPNWFAIGVFEETGELAQRCFGEKL